MFRADHRAMNWKALIRIAAYLLVYLGVPLITSKVTN